MTTQDGTMDFARELFARGYVLSSSGPVNAPGHWLSAEFRNFHVRHDPRLPANRAAAREAELLCLGIIFDVRHPHRTPAECVADLAAALGESEHAFLSELSCMNGRHVIMYCRKDACSILTDATGMKSAFYYRREKTVIASHPELVAENGEFAESRPKIRLKFGYPGIDSHVAHCRLLTPNTKLDLATMRVERFWPRRKPDEISVDTAAERVHAALNGGLEHAFRFHDPIISVTAGLDSRTTISLLKDGQNPELFTYYRADDMDTDRLDADFAQQYGQETGRDVEIVTLRDWGDAPDEFRTVQNRNTVAGHIRKLAWIYYQKHGANPKALHVRSNISEVGREFWKGKKFPVRSGTDLARIYLYGDREYPASYVFDVIERFNEFDRVTGLTGCAEMVDIKSLFYWEFRMASWHAGVVVESDPAFETISLFNCRYLLETMLSVPKEARQSSIVLRRVIAGANPRLAEFDVNGKPFWPAGTGPVSTDSVKAS